MLSIPTFDFPCSGQMWSGIEWWPLGCPETEAEKVPFPYAGVVTDYDAETTRRSRIKYLLYDIYSRQIPCRPLSLSRTTWLPRPSYPPLRTF